MTAMKTIFSHEQGKTVFMTGMKTIFSFGTRRNGLHAGDENHFLFRNKEKRSS
ncbi:hypothetical protein [Bacillus dakarensis]|uniref:hypothetical protein n=1 Tax=Robertmurraya dakarensis TaxID=1926278 RepID=UPI0012B69B70|nr:hypothetical protein [Bacillus dakarensis]